jgi:hypothetical protein
MADHIEIQSGPNTYAIYEEERRVVANFEDPQTRRMASTRVEFEPEHTIIDVGNVRVIVGTHRVKVLVQRPRGEKETLYDGKPL